MKTTFIIFFIIALLPQYIRAQTFEVDTLQYYGDISKHINFVILGDGYMASEQDGFISDAKKLSGYLLAQSPWSHYKAYFNVFAIKVISNESGAIHPNTASDCSSAQPSVPVSNPDTYLGCSFDSYGIHRLLVPMNTANIAAVLATNFPSYDQVLITSNSPYYGGSGGEFATASLESTSDEIVAHEIGHSFAYLADEYWAGPSYAIEKPNMTQQSNPTLIKWKNWLKAGTGIAIVPFAENPSWFKPSSNCKMRALGLNYCSVCKEAIIEKIHSLVNPIVRYSPDLDTISSQTPLLNFSLDTVIFPSPNTLRIGWNLDGAAIIAKNDSVKIDQQKLSIGSHILTVSVLDTTDLVKIDSHFTNHLHYITWTIKKAAAGGVRIASGDNAISCSIFPNPASKILNIMINMEKDEKLFLEIISLDGKVVQHIADGIIVNHTYSVQTDISHLAQGAYTLVYKVGDVLDKHLFIKQ